MTDRIVVGVCAMDSKARSSPMRKILDRLMSYNEFEIIIFGDKAILDEPVPSWPICDVLISFFSKGFPLDKAIEYVELRQPFSINDLPLQQVLLDRRIVLAILDAIDVPTPRRVQMNRDAGPALPPLVMEILSRNFNVDLVRNPFKHSPLAVVDADTIEVGGKRLTKPFVEKPVDGEDHNVYIYYHSSQGGGVRRLFRKIGNRSSVFLPGPQDLRTDASYIYEQFLESENCEDVKVYTVGPLFAHAETRRSPAIDGIVKRNAEGKEVRYATTLSEGEADIARRICMAFGQAICGYDMLRAGGRSYVVDVNGWSFVKGNDVYYDQCAKILRDTFLRAFGKKRGSISSDALALGTRRWQLQAFVGIFRHADRTPKQKRKFKVSPAVLSSLLPASPDGLLVGQREIEELISVLANAGCDQELLEILRSKACHQDLKVQVKNSSGSDCLLIVKWGGEFTHSGRHQARELADSLRQDLCILNKSLIDATKISTSFERRAVASAEIFAKSFMPYAELPLNLIAVDRDSLDDHLWQKDQDEQFRIKLRSQLSDEGAPATAIILRLLEEWQQLLTAFFQDLEATPRVGMRWCCAESSTLFIERWSHLFRTALCRGKSLSLSLICELHDSLLYDSVHNRSLLQRISNDPSLRLVVELFSCVRSLYDLVCPNEYGISCAEKMNISRRIVGKLTRRIIDDLREVVDESKPATRLYFTKESHMFTLFNALQCSRMPLTFNDRPRFDYLSHITFELFQRKPGSFPSEPVEYAVRLAMSRGAYAEDPLAVELNSSHHLSVLPRETISEYISYVDFERALLEFLGE